MNSNSDKIINAVLFQVLWFAAVLYGWSVALLPLILLLVHFARAIDNGRTIAPWLVLAGLGIFGDSVLAAISVYSFPSEQTMLPVGVPVWLVFMWLGFVATMPLSMSWLFSSRWLVLGLFTLGGPLSYSAGRALGAINFDNQDALYVVGLWALLGLCTLGLSRFSGTRPLASAQ